MVAPPARPAVQARAFGPKAQPFSQPRASPGAGDPQNSPRRPEGPIHHLTPFIYTKREMTPCRNRSLAFGCTSYSAQRDVLPISFENQEFREELFRMLGYHANEIKCPVARVGGWHDHVHVLCGLARTVTVAELVEVLSARPRNGQRSVPPIYRPFTGKMVTGHFP